MADGPATSRIGTAMASIPRKREGQTAQEMQDIIMEAIKRVYPEHAMPMTLTVSDSASVRFLEYTIQFHHPALIAALGQEVKHGISKACDTLYAAMLMLEELRLASEEKKVDAYRVQAADVMLHRLQIGASLSTLQELQRGKNKLEDLQRSLRSSEVSALHLLQSMISALSTAMDSFYEAAHGRNAVMVGFQGEGKSTFLSLLVHHSLTSRAYESCMPTQDELLYRPALQALRDDSCSSDPLRIKAPVKYQRPAGQGVMDPGKLQACLEHPINIPLMLLPSMCQGGEATSSVNLEMAWWPYCCMTCSYDVENMQKLSGYLLWLDVEWNTRLKSKTTGLQMPREADKAAWKPYRAAVRLAAQQVQSEMEQLTVKSPELTPSSRKEDASALVGHSIFLQFMGQEVPFDEQHRIIKDASLLPQPLLAQKFFGVKNFVVHGPTAADMQNSGCTGQPADEQLLSVVNFLADMLLLVQGKGTAEIMQRLQPYLPDEFRDLEEWTKMSVMLKSEIQLFLPAELLAAGLTVMDTPGFGITSHPEHIALTTRALQDKGNLVLLFINSKLEQSTLKASADSYIPRMLAADREIAAGPSVDAEPCELAVVLCGEVNHRQTAGQHVLQATLKNHIKYFDTFKANDDGIKAAVLRAVDKELHTAQDSIEPQNEGRQSAQVSEGPGGVSMPWGQLLGKDGDDDDDDDDEEEEEDNDDVDMAGKTLLDAGKAASDKEAADRQQRMRLQPRCVVARPLLTAAMQHAPTEVEAYRQQAEQDGGPTPDDVLHYAGTSNAEWLLFAVPGYKLLKLLQGPIMVARSTVSAVEAMQGQHEGQHSSRQPCNRPPLKRRVKEVLAQVRADDASSSITEAFSIAKQLASRTFQEPHATHFPVASGVMMQLHEWQKAQKAISLAQHIEGFLNNLQDDVRQNLGDYITAAVKGAHQDADLARSFLDFLQIDHLVARLNSEVTRFSQSAVHQLATALAAGIIDVHDTLQIAEPAGSLTAVEPYLLHYVQKLIKDTVDGCLKAVDSAALRSAVLEPSRAALVAAVKTAVVRAKNQMGTLGKHTRGATKHMLAEQLAAVLSSPELAQQLLDDAWRGIKNNLLHKLGVAAWHVELELLPECGAGPKGCNKGFRGGQTTRRGYAKVAEHFIRGQWWLQDISSPGMDVVLQGLQDVVASLEKQQQKLQESATEGAQPPSPAPIATAAATAGGKTASRAPPTGASSSITGVPPQSAPHSGRTSAAAQQLQEQQLQYWTKLLTTRSACTTHATAAAVVAAGVSPAVSDKIAAMGGYIVRNSGDGNCQFISFLQCLFQQFNAPTDDEVTQMRTAVAGKLMELAAQLPDLRAALQAVADADGLSINDYVEAKLQMSGEHSSWGDHLTLMILATMHRVRIVLFDSEDANKETAVLPLDVQQRIDAIGAVAAGAAAAAARHAAAGLRTLYMVFTAEVHYEAVVFVDDANDTPASDLYVAAAAASDHHTVTAEESEEDSVELQQHQRQQPVQAKMRGAGGVSSAQHSQSAHSKDSRLTPTSVPASGSGRGLAAVTTAPSQQRKRSQNPTSSTPDAKRRVSDQNLLPY